MNTSDRLRQERERLGLNQVEFGAVGGVKKLAQINYEKGERSPDSGYLAAIAAAGADVLYILTGVHAAPPLDAAEQVLIDSYRRCKPDARVNLIQTAALLSAGLDTPSKQSVPAGTQVGNITQHSTADGTVQVGYAGGRVRVKK